MAMTMAARQARSMANILRPSYSNTQSVFSPRSQLITSRGFAADHGEPPKVNFWQAPLSPSIWKEEHFVLLSWAGWGLLIYGGYKGFSRIAKKDGKVEKVQEGSH